MPVCLSFLYLAVLWLYIAELVFMHLHGSEIEQALELVFMHSLL